MRRRRADSYGRCTLNPERTGLLVVDMQGLFLGPGSRSYMPQAAAIAANVLKLVDVFRARRREPFFTRHALVDPRREGGRMLKRWRNVCLDGSEEARIDSRFKAKARRQFRKTRYNAFTHPMLEPALRAEGIEDLVVCGVATHLCVESTARSAFDLDFRVFLVADASASRRKELHAASLRTMADGVARIVSSAEVVRALAVPLR